MSNIERKDKDTDTHLIATNPGPLTNSMSDTTTNGVLENMSGIGTINQATVSRNLSELNVKLNAIRQVLIDSGQMEE